MPNMYFDTTSALEDAFTKQYGDDALVKYEPDKVHKDWQEGGGGKVVSYGRYTVRVSEDIAWWKQGFLAFGGLVAGVLTVGLLFIPLISRTWCDFLSSAASGRWIHRETRWVRDPDPKTAKVDAVASNSEPFGPKKPVLSVNLDAALVAAPTVPSPPRGAAPEFVRFVPPIEAGLRAIADNKPRDAVNMLLAARADFDDRARKAIALELDKINPLLAPALAPEATVVEREERMRDLNQYLTLVGIVRPFVEKDVDVAVAIMEEAQKIPKDKLTSTMNQFQRNATAMYWTLYLARGIWNQPFERLNIMYSGCLSISPEMRVAIADQNIPVRPLDRPEHILGLAIQAWASSPWGESESFYRQLLQLKPEELTAAGLSPDLMKKGLVQVLYDKARFRWRFNEGALRGLQEAAQLDPDNVAIRYGLAECQLRSAAIPRSVSIPFAEALVNEHPSLRPVLASVYSDEGRYLHDQKKDTTGAIAAFEKAVKHHPNIGDYLYLCALHIFEKPVSPERLAAAEQALASAEALQSPDAPWLGIAHMKSLLNILRNPTG